MKRMQLDALSQNLSRAISPSTSKQNATTRILEQFEPLPILRPPQAPATPPTRPKLDTEETGINSTPVSVDTVSKLAPVSKTQGSIEPRRSAPLEVPFILGRNWSHFLGSLFWAVRIQSGHFRIPFLKSSAPGSATTPGSANSRLSSRIGILRTLGTKTKKQTAGNQYTNRNHSYDQHSNGEYPVAPQIPSQPRLSFVQDWKHHF